MSTIATTISLVHFTDTIFDQQTQGSCKANQIAGAVQMMSKMTGNNIEDLSRQALYNDTRELMGTFDRDSGSYASSAEKAAMTKGLINESDFAYGLNNLYQKPPADAYSHSLKVTSFNHAAPEGNSGFFATYVNNALAQGKPVLVDAYVHYGFGVDLNSFVNPINGGHAYLIVGVDNVSRTYTVQNSWGTNWADGGYGTIKFSDLPGIGPTSGGAYGSPYQDLLGISTINGFGNTNLQWTADRVNVAQHYATILGRAAEVSGLDWWANAKLDDETLTTSLLNSAEGQALYGNVDNSTFVHEMYEHVLGRDADVSGLAFYTGFLDQGWSRGKIMNIVINAVETSNTDVGSHDFLANLTNLSTYVSVTMQYHGGFDSVVANALHSVTSDANTVEILKVGLQETIHGIV